MAKIKKLTLDGATIYPATIMEAVKNRATNKTLAAELLTLAKAVNSGATTPDAALSALTALGTGYNSIVAVATTLKDFLTNATDTDTVINKWKEVEAFLNGIDEGSNILSKFVTTDTQQTITGRKDFTNGITASGSSAFDNIQITGDIDIQNDCYIAFEEGFHISTAFGDIEPPAGSGVLALKSDIPSIPGTATQSANGLMSAADKKKLDNIADGANNYSLPAATASVLGGVKLGSDTAQSVAANAVSATASRTYAVQKNASGQLVVNVPWSDTNTTYNAATQSTNGLMSAADKKKLDAFGAATTYLTAAACNDVTDYPEITI